VRLCYTAAFGRKYGQVPANPTCRVFNNLVDVGTLDGKKDLFLFERGIEPDWDDEGNVPGGLWLVHCNECLKADIADGRPDTALSLDSLWRDTVRHARGAWRTCAGRCQRPVVCRRAAHQTNVGTVRAVTITAKQRDLRLVCRCIMWLASSFPTLQTSLVLP
jgi:Eukaryotic initiation factor 4E